MPLPDEPSPRPTPTHETTHTGPAAPMDATSAPRTSTAPHLTPDAATRIIEALLFASESPITLQQIRDVLGTVEPAQVQEYLRALQQTYANQHRAFYIETVAGGYQMATDPQLGPWIRKLYKEERSDRLSTAALETLAIVAFRQPMTRSDIEQVRGVNVDGVMRTLLEKGLVNILGRKEAPGRPVLYGTTKEFLQHFGLNSLVDLPPLSEAQPSATEATPVKMLHEVEQDMVETVAPVSEPSPASTETHTP